MAATWKGRFRPKHPEKYKGDPTEVYFRSRWEMVAMSRLDLDSSVLQWSSEETPIPYKSPKDNRIHRYFPDLWIKRRMPDGSIRTSLVEIKPRKELLQPVKGNKSDRTFLVECATYAVNQAKWEAARAYAKAKGWTFEIATEVELGLTRG